LRRFADKAAIFYRFVICDLYLNKKILFLNHKFCETGNRWLFGGVNSKLAPFWGLQTMKPGGGLRLADRQTFERFLMATEPHERRALI
jgi:hypothetical protein